jgi:predicted nucleic acid-binding protein
MRYVLDSSVAVKCVLTEVDSDKAIRLRDDARVAIHSLLSPDIFPIEAGHALTRAERQLRITPPNSRSSCELSAISRQPNTVLAEG